VQRPVHKRSRIQRAARRSAKVVTGTAVAARSQTEPTLGHVATPLRLALLVAKAVGHARRWLPVAGDGRRPVGSESAEVVHGLPRHAAGGGVTAGGEWS